VTANIVLVHRISVIRNSIVLTVDLMLSSFSGNLSATDEGPCREALASFQLEL
jgi:hypothetical protein